MIRTRARHAAASLMVTSLLALLLPACSKEAEPPPPKVAGEPGVIRFATGSPDLDALAIVPVVSEPLPVSADLNARLVVDEAVTGRVGAPVAARVTAVLADIGQRVGAGQALARVDAPDLAQATADLIEARTAADLKFRAAARTRELLAGGAIAARDAETAEAESRNAGAELSRARERLQSLGGGSGTNLPLTAPIAGVVLDRAVEPGQQLTPGQGPLFTVTDPSRLWLLIDAPETTISRLRIGQAIDFEVDAWPGTRFAAVVQKIGLAVDPGTRRVQVRGRVDNRDLKLKPEMFARARLVADDGVSGLRIPNAALFERGLNSFVFRQESPGMFRRIQVKVAVRGEQASWVSSGLRAGDKVVGEGALLLNAQLGDE